MQCSLACLSITLLSCSCILVLWATLTCSTILVYQFCDKFFWLLKWIYELPKLVGPTVFWGLFIILVYPFLADCSTYSCSFPQSLHTWNCILHTILLILGDLYCAVLQGKHLSEAASPQGVLVSLYLGNFDDISFKYCWPRLLYDCHF